MMKMKREKKHEKNNSTLFLHNDTHSRFLPPPDPPAAGG
jgi:hypothetical protein